MANSTYRKKHYNDLVGTKKKQSIRAGGWSIEEVCIYWGITRMTYHNWRKAHTEFEYAHEIGEMHKVAYWRSKQRKVGSGEEPGNAAIINLALKNEVGYVDKQEIEHTHNEQITTIRIERIESPAPRVIEHERTESITHQQSS